MGVTQNAIIKALIASDGVVTEAAKRLKLTRDAVQKRIAKSPKLRQVQLDARDQIVDYGETSLSRAVKDGESWAVTLALKTLGKDRGYVEKKQYEHQGGIKIENVDYSQADTDDFGDGGYQPPAQDDSDEE